MGDWIMNALSQYLKKDKSSGSMLYSIPKKDLDSIDFKTFPVDLSGDITKKLAINNGVGTVAISNDNIQIVFVDATIQDIAKALKKQNISITDTPNNELLVILDEGGGHFKAVLQNSTHHIIHNFYPGTPLFLDSSDDDEEDDDDDSSDVLMSSLELLMLPIILYLPSSCKLASKNSGTQIYNGTFARPNNYKMPKDSLFVKHDGSYVVRFKVSDTEFYKVQETILDIDNQCKTKTLLYSPIPDEIQTENCFTSINRLVKAANIQTPYMQYFF